MPDADARGPGYLERVNRFVRFRPTRSTVLRLGPLKRLPGSVGAGESDFLRCSGWALEGVGLPAGMGSDFCEVYAGEADRTWELVTREVRDGVVVDEVSDGLRSGAGVCASGVVLVCVPRGWCWFVCLGSGAGVCVPPGG